MKDITLCKCESGKTKICDLSVLLLLLEEFFFSNYGFIAMMQYSDLENENATAFTIKSAIDHENMLDIFEEFINLDFNNAQFDDIDGRLFVSGYTDTKYFTIELRVLTHEGYDFYKHSLELDSILNGHYFNTAEHMWKYEGYTADPCFVERLQKNDYMVSAR